MTTVALLRAAADALEEGTDPFSTAFLTEHGVTFEQASSLADQLAIGARIMARGIEKPHSEQGMAMVLTMAEAL
jgi:hypothetical protein